MIVSTLDSRERRALEQALREGRPVTWRVPRPTPPWRADEWVPLVDAVVADDPRLVSTFSAHLPPARRPHPARVTAVIPTHRHTPVGLAALRDQDVDLDVLVLANGDAPADVAGDRVWRLPWEGHGRTRQRGVEEASGDYVLLCTDDVLPRGAGCVRTLVEALEEGGYDAVFARQIPWPTSSPITRERLREWTPPGRGHWEVERHDHVFALYRRTTLLQHPLPPVPIGEDLHWRRGRRVGYVPGAPVVHAHPRRVRELYVRTLALHRQLNAAGQAPTVPDLKALLDALPGAIAVGAAHGPREAACQVAELLGQWTAKQFPEQ